MTEYHDNGLSKPNPIPKGGSGYKWNINDVLCALRDTNGDLTGAAKVLQVSRASLKNYVDKTPDANNFLDSTRSALLDKAEKNYYKAVFDGDLQASRFILTTIGKHRGYTTSSEITGRDGAALVPTTFNVLPIASGTFLKNNDEDGEKG